MGQTLAGALLLGALAAFAPVARADTLCDINTKCPASAPCCSPFGYCNTGAFCLGGCQPMYSFTETSCKPLPVCEDHTTDFSDLSRVLQNGTTYDGNATAYDWTVDKGELLLDPDGNGARLVLTDTNGGTLISSTRYVHYGQIDFELRSSKWNGVVTAAITMSDVKDEIDIEFPGSATTQMQSNYFFLGIANYSDTNGEVHNGFQDTSANFHVYSINWQEDQLQWLVDGRVVRTVLKTDTLSEDGTQYKYPTTPSRVQFSIWPAGIQSSAEGTVTWAGGMIDWSDPDYVQNGYFYNTVKSVTVKCADSNAARNSSIPGITGYQYVGNDSTNVPAIEFTNRSTVLGSGAVSTVSMRTGFGGVLGVLAIAALPSLMFLF